MPWFWDKLWCTEVSLLKVLLPSLTTLSEMLMLRCWIVPEVWVLQQSPLCHLFINYVVPCPDYGLNKAVDLKWRPEVLLTCWTSLSSPCLDSWLMAAVLWSFCGSSWSDLQEPKPGGSGPAAPKGCLGRLHQCQKLTELPEQNVGVWSGCGVLNHIYLCLN